MAISVERFEYSIDVPSPCKFCTDKKNNIMQYLQENIEHTCFRGCMIVKILDINDKKLSLCRIITSNNSGYGTIHFEFIAQVLRYPRGSIVPKVTVDTKEGLMFAKGEYITISLSNKDTNNHRLLREGQQIPVIITNMIYSNCSRSVNAVGRLITCANNVKYWRTEGTLSSNEIKELKSIINTSLIDLPNTKEYKFVSDMMYSYKNVVTPPKSAIDILDIISREGFDMRGYWYKDLSIHPDNTLFIRSDTLPEAAILHSNKVSVPIMGGVYNNNGSSIDAAVAYDITSPKPRAKAKAKAKPKAKASKYNTNGNIAPISSNTDLYQLTGNAQQMTVQEQIIQKIPVDILTPVEMLSSMIASVISWRNAIKDISENYSIDDDKYLWTILENNKV